MNWYIRVRRKGLKGVGEWFNMFAESETQAWELARKHWVHFDVLEVKQ
jgi:hypothetical protein